MTDRAAALLAGPRGRRLCAERVERVDGGVGVPGHWHLPATIGRGRAQDDVRAALAITDLTGLTECGRLHEALLAAVDSARYWQEPDDVDQVLTDDAVADMLLPVAGAVTAAPAAGWWAEPLCRDDQHAVAWEFTDPPLTTGTHGRLVQWRTDTLIDDERAARERPRDPTAAWGGHWWSTPAGQRLVVTTRTRPALAADGFAPVGLLLVEDEMGWRTARSWPVHPPADVGVLELTRPADWVALVARYPLAVTASRRHDWWRTTGWDGEWLVPDWTAVAEDYDGVHLTVDGYLSTAGRALSVPGTDARTLLGGWDPDAIWWLTDVLPGLGEPTDWHRRDDESPRWAAAR